MRYKDINLYLDEYSGGDVVAQFGGIPPNCNIEYISVSFLDGIVNYLDNRRAFMMNRYGLSDYPALANNGEVTQRECYRKAANEIAEMPHSELLTYDDVLLFGETENSFYYLWYDNDVSDCCIQRVSKETFPTLTLDDYVQLILTQRCETFDCWQHDFTQDEPMFIEFKPNGWVSS